MNGWIPELLSFQIPECHDCLISELRIFPNSAFWWFEIFDFLKFWLVAILTFWKFDLLISEFQLILISDLLISKHLNLLISEFQKFWISERWNLCGSPRFLRFRYHFHEFHANEEIFSLWSRGPSLVTGKAQHAVLPGCPPAGALDLENKWIL